MKFTTQLISFMKQIKDRMDKPLVPESKEKLIATAKLVGATHADITTVIGYKNFVSETRDWLIRFNKAGLKPVLRCSHANMEKDKGQGLYNLGWAVGLNRKSQEFYIQAGEEALKAVLDLLPDGAEIAFYTERTEGIFDEKTSWIWPNTPDNYANFFNIFKDHLDAIIKPTGKKIETGLQSNNASEFITRWMSKKLTDKVSLVVIDYYQDGNPIKFEANIRAIYKNYGKPIYIQESAPHRTTFPTLQQIQAYHAVVAKLRAEGIVVKYGHWGMWPGTPEGCINADFTLNKLGWDLQQLFTQDEYVPIDITQELNRLEAVGRQVIDQTELLRKLIE